MLKAETELFCEHCCTVIYQSQISSGSFKRYGKIKYYYAAGQFETQKGLQNLPAGYLEDTRKRKMAQYTRTWEEAYKEIENRKSFHCL